MHWWRDARFGMFNHRGLSSALEGEHQDKSFGTGCTEWYQNPTGLDTDTYGALTKPNFKPTPDCAKARAVLAKDALHGKIPAGRVTHKGWTIYLLVFDRPADGVITLPLANGEGVSARLLADGAALKAAASPLNPGSFCRRNFRTPLLRRRLEAQRRAGSRSEVTGFQRHPQSRVFIDAARCFFASLNPS